MPETITTAQDGGVLTITLNRPDVLNAFNDQMSAEMQEALQIPVRAVDRPELLPEGCDMLAACTDSNVPVITPEARERSRPTRRTTPTRSNPGPSPPPR